jgi:hypothetical protein
LWTGDAELEGIGFVSSSEADCRALKAPMLRTNRFGKSAGHLCVRVCVGSRGSVLETQSVAKTGSILTLSSGAAAG